MSARPRYSHEEKRKPYCLVKTIEVVSCSVLNHLRSMPSQHLTEVIELMSADCTRLANLRRSRARTVRPASADQAAGWPRLAECLGAARGLLWR